MDKSLYHTALKQMHDAGVDVRYYHGWASGALENPEIEEQRSSEAYTAGYEDGKAGNAEGYTNWLADKS